MAQVPSATREILSCVVGTSTNSVSAVGTRSCVDGAMNRPPHGHLIAASKSVRSRWARGVSSILQVSPAPVTHETGGSAREMARHHGLPLLDALGVDERWLKPQI